MAFGVTAWNFFPFMAMVPVAVPIFSLDILKLALAPFLLPTTAAVLSSIFFAWSAFWAVALMQTIANMSEISFVFMLLYINNVYMFFISLFAPLRTHCMRPYI